MFESTATWMEEIVYPAVNDYLQYIGPWAREVERAADRVRPAEELKVYGQRRLEPLPRAAGSDRR